MSQYTAARVLSEFNTRPAYVVSGSAVRNQELESAVMAAVRVLSAADSDAQEREFGARMTATLAAYGLGSPAPNKPFAFANGVAVIPVHGVLINRFPSSWGFVTGYDFIRRQTAEAAADPDVQVIAYDHHSPGGTVAGCPETYSAILAVRGTKKTVAIVDSAAYSAAYYLASAADKIVVTPSGGVGSIGVVAARWDVTKMAENEGVKVTFIYAGKHKLAGNPMIEMSDDEKKRIQASVDSAYDGFVSAVAAGRGISEDAVRATEAACFDAEDALRAGLVNDIMTPDMALQAALASEEDDDMTVQGSPAQPGAAAETVDATAVAAQATTAERARIAGILASDEAKDRPSMALHLATKTGMSVDDAKGLLAVAAVETAPAAQVTNPLEAAMAAAGTPAVGADPANLAGANTPEAKAGGLLAAYAAATGIKFPVN